MEKDYPGNARSSRRRDEKEEEDRVPRKAVVSGKVRKRKTPVHKRFISAFIPDREEEETLGDYLIMEVAARIREMILNTGMDTLEWRLGGGRGRSRHSSDRTRYRDRGERYRGERGDSRELSRRGRARHDFGELIFESKVEVDAVIDDLYDLLETDEIVTVGDLLELSDYETTPMDRRYGWDDLRGTRAVRMGNGEYLLELPPPIDIR